MDQWNRTEGPEINPHTCRQLFYDKGGEKTEWRKDRLFSEWCWESWTVACKSMKPEHTLTPFTKTDSKRFKDWKIRHSTIKLLEENIGKTFSDINHTNVFLGWSLKAKKAKINPEILEYCLSWQCEPSRRRAKSEEMSPEKSRSPATKFLP